MARIVSDVRNRGDEALSTWTARLDGVEVEQWEVDRLRWCEAYRALPSEISEALDLAARRIRTFHEQQRFSSWTFCEGAGYSGQRVIPLERVGIYVPGGAVPLPSSLLMAAIPARVAGVEEIVVCTPPSRETAEVAPIILAAAYVAGVDRLFRVGGAQAIAAMAFGTRSIPRVHKIVGAGGLFTTLAKREVFGYVG
ncbi:MAG: histidinol dehydrogenase, partial [Chloroflexia bacterium]